MDTVVLCAEVEEDEECPELSLSLLLLYEWIKMEGEKKKK